MAQISSGSANVVNASNIVELPGADLSAVLVGHAFHIRGIDAVYSIIAADALADPPTLQLSVPYAGASASAADYRITTGFSPLNNLYEPDPGDVDIAMLLKHRLVRLIDGGYKTVQSGVITAPVEGLTVIYSGITYSAAPHVSVTIYDATAGDYACITDPTASGFQVVIKDFSNIPVERNISWLAKGV